MNAKSAYEENAIREIHAWKNPTIGWFGEAMRALNYPLDKAGDLLLDTPGVGTVIKSSVEGLTSICNDAAHYSVRPEAIYEEFRESGHRDVHGVADIRKMHLEEVDKVVGWLAAKYKGLALVEGASTGAAGIFGIPVDLVSLVTLNLRAIAEYATYYGFDIRKQEERLFALNMLGLASSPTDASKTVAMAQLVRISKDVAKKVAWKELEKSTFVKIIQQISKALGIRLTKAKLAQFLPGFGIVIGGGFNAYFTMKVCDTAYYLYRERFLADRYGENVIEETVAPAENVDPDYPDADEIDQVG